MLNPPGMNLRVYPSRAHKFAPSVNELTSHWGVVGEVQKRTGMV